MVVLKTLRIFIILSLIALCLTLVAESAVADSNYLFVTNYYSKSVSVINTDTNGIVTTLETNPYPVGVALNPAGTYLYVVGSTGILDIYNTADWSRKVTLQLNNTCQYNWVSISHDGEYAFFSVKGSDGDGIIKLALANNTEVGFLLLGAPGAVNPHDIQYMEDYDRYYVIGRDTKLYYFQANNTGSYSSATINTSTHSSNVVYNNLYLTSIETDKLYVYTSGAWTSETGVNNPCGVARSIMTTDRVYVGNNTHISQFSTAGALQDVISLGGSGFTVGQLVSDTDSPYVYAHLTNNTVCVVNTINNSVAGYIPVGSDSDNSSYDDRSQMCIGSIGVLTDDMKLTQLKFTTAWGSLLLNQYNITIKSSDSTIIYYATTDDAGAIGILLSPYKTYTVSVDCGNGVMYDAVISPANDVYSIDVPVSYILGINLIQDQFLNTTAQNAVSFYMSSSLNTTSNNASLLVFYEDTIPNTNHAYFYLYKNNTTEIGSTPILLSIVDAEINGANTNLTYTFNQTTAAGCSYYVKINATQTDGTNKTYYLAVTFPGPKVLNGVLPLDWFWWMAFIPTVFLMSAGTATRKGIIGFIGVSWGFIALAWGWWSLYVPDLIMAGVLAAGLVFCVVVWVGETERYR